MISNNLIQAALVAKLKANALLVAALSSANEIREQQWQGRDFAYPNIRVDLGVQRPYIPDCPLVSIPFSVLCYSEKASSEESNNLAYLVNTALDNRPFTHGGVKFVSITFVDADSSVREDARTWKTSVNFSSLVQIA